MKALLLIGASLMAGAGIYGYADYKKANLRKEFQSLYKEEPTKVAQEAVLDIAPAPSVVDPVPTDVPVYVVKNGVVVAEENPGMAETPVKAVKMDIVQEEKKLEAISKKYEKQQKTHTVIKPADFSRAALEKKEIILPETGGKVKP